MPVTYTNRKGRKYYLCKVITKTGKPRYFFAREPKGELVDEIPPGYEISESVNGIVSLVKVRPKSVTEKDVEVVKKVLSEHPQARRYRIWVKPKEIIVYERVGPDYREIIEKIAPHLGLVVIPEEIIRRMEEENEKHAQYTPVMKFVVDDEERRLFHAERMCYLGGIDDWIVIESGRSIEYLAEKLIPTLGTDEFFMLV